MSIGQTIKLYRKNSGFTQSELAELLGVSTQAVSKWETDAGMPDVSQIVPLAKALNVSTDEILGFHKDAETEELMVLREKIGHHPVKFSSAEAERIYGLAHPFFCKHPTVSEAAFWCLEALSVLLPSRLEREGREELFRECLRYENCIFRYERNADILFKSYYVLSRCYKMLGEQRRADEIMERIPDTFGDRAYWEAEFAYADKNLPLAIEKCKLSFHDKARYISRCIRLIRTISVERDGAEGLETQIALSEYMLTMINAFLSGGEYLPHRMVYQKMALLEGMVWQYAKLGRAKRALECMEEMIDLRTSYEEFLKNPSEKHCLMFPEGDDDGRWHVTPEKVKRYVESAWKKASLIPEVQNTAALQRLQAKMEQSV